MKKIMFNDRYGLTSAVLEGVKTMTRRIAYDKPDAHDTRFGWKPNALNDNKLILLNGWKKVATTHYGVGDIVAIAQSYKDCGHNPMQIEETNISKPTVFPEIGNGEYLGRVKIPLKYHQGWKNKMYTKPNLMPHHIRITGIKAQKLQDISDEECLKEGVLQRVIRPFRELETAYQIKHTPIYKSTPREAFAILIDKISGKGTWERNPWVFAYEFELID